MSSSARAVLCILLAPALAGLAQELKPEAVLEGTAAAAKQYLHDATELPLRVTTTISEYDAGGRLRKTRRDTHSFRIVQARPDEYKAHAQFSLGATLFHHGSVVEQVDADLTTMVAGMLLRPGPREKLEFEVTQAGPGSPLVLHYRSQADCPAFELRHRHAYLPTWCGSGDYAVDAPGFALRHFTFVAGGTPMIGGKKLRGYRLEETFQSVTVPGETKPLVLPRTITAVLERENGKTVLSSDFALAGEGAD